MEESSVAERSESYPTSSLERAQEEQIGPENETREPAVSVVSKMNVRLVSCLTNLLRSLLMGVLHQICLVVRNHFLLEKDRKLRLSVPVCRAI